MNKIAAFGLFLKPSYLLIFHAYKIAEQQKLKSWLLSLICGSVIARDPQHVCKCRFVHIISWIASRLIRSSHSTGPTSTFGSTEVNLPTEGFPVQTLKTGLIKRSLAVLKWMEPSEFWCLFLDVLLNEGCSLSPLQAYFKGPFNHF